MHPEIRKFWEDAGYLVDKMSTTRCFARPTDADIYWTVQKGKSTPNIIAITLGNGKCKYYVGDNWYWEEEALKVVRWKVFL